MVIARISNLLGKITILVMVGLCVNTAMALDGSGTQQDPWRIKSLEDFNEFAGDPNYWDDYTRLETDVNLAGITYTTAVIAPDIDNSNDAFDGTSFTGVFDGNGHTITNLIIDTGGVANDYLGLFGQTEGSGAEVKNLGLEGGYVIGPVVDDCGDIGCLIGRNGGTVSNCYATGDVRGGEQVGGLVGDNDNSISGCYATGNVSGTDDAGGLVGDNEYSHISNCYATGSVNSGEHTGGGLAGDNEGGIITNCYSTGDVSGGGSMGGLIGYNPLGSVTNSYAKGSVNCSGTNNGGGLVGDNDNDNNNKIGTITNCYSIGDVNGTGSIGGLIGDNYDSNSVTNSFWDTESSGQSTSAGGSGKTTAQMHRQYTFTDWDFINVWNIGENQTYPYLRVYLAADLNKDGIVNFLDVAITANQWLQGVQ